MSRLGPLYVAMHEAGHAVAMLANAPSPFIRYVTVGSGDHRFEGFTAAVARFQPSLYDGDVEMSDEVRSRLSRNAWLDILDALAGPIAEARFRGASRLVRSIEAYRLARVVADHRIELEHGEDADFIRRRLTWLDASRMEEHFIEAAAEAEELVAAHWERIDDLGRWLHAVTRIEGDELREWWCRRGVNS